MKKTLLKFGLLPCLLLVLAVSSCKKDDPTLAEQMAGDWEVTSYTEDGEEYMQVELNAFNMEYESYADDEGDFTWSLTLVDGSSVNLSGDWSVDEADKDAELVFKAGSLSGTTATFDIDLDGNDLELEGNVDGFAVRIKAKRD